MLKSFLISISNGVVIVRNSSKTSFVIDIKEKQESDPILLQLKGVVRQQNVKVFSREGDGVIHY